MGLEKNSRPLMILVDMTYNEYEREFRKKAKNIGYSEANIVERLNYAKPLIEKKLPIIYNTSHFSRLIGYNRTYLRRAITHTRFFYRVFNIKKKNGKTRIISEPLPNLKDIQSWILNNILYQIIVCYQYNVNILYILAILFNCHVTKFNVCQVLILLLLMLYLCNV